MPIKYKETVDEARNYPALSDMVEQYDFHKPLGHCCTKLVEEIKGKIDAIKEKENLYK